MSRFEPDTCLDRWRLAVAVHGHAVPSRQRGPGNLGEDTTPVHLASVQIAFFRVLRLVEGACRVRLRKGGW